jgi:hypothetical protein
VASQFVFGQQTGNASSSGSCSPANTGNNNQFTINCGIGQAQGKKLIDILNKILTRQLDPDAVLSKLDEIKSDLDELKRKSTETVVGAKTGDVVVQPGGVASFGQQGGITAQQVNITPKKPARHIPADIHGEMVRLLAQAPGLVFIQAFVGDTEAYQFADEIRSVFKSANWTLIEDGSIRSFVETGKPWTGLLAEVQLAGKAGDQVTITGWRNAGVLVLESASKVVPFEYRWNVVPSDQDKEIKISVGPQAQ